MWNRKGLLALVVLMYLEYGFSRPEDIKPVESVVPGNSTTPLVNGTNGTAFTKNVTSPSVENRFFGLDGMFNQLFPSFQSPFGQNGGGNGFYPPNNNNQQFYPGNQWPGNNFGQGPFQYPSQGQFQYPNQGQFQNPDQGQFQNPNQQYPNDRQSQYPNQGLFQNPNQGQFQYPNEGQTQYPNEGQSQYPSQGQSQYPSQGQFQNPNQGFYPNGVYPGPGEDQGFSPGTGSFPYQHPSQNEGNQNIPPQQNPDQLQTPGQEGFPIESDQNNFNNDGINHGTLDSIPPQVNGSVPPTYENPDNTNQLPPSNQFDNDEGQNGPVPFPNENGQPDPNGIDSTLSKVVVPSTTPSDQIVFMDSAENPSQKQCVQDCGSSSDYQPVCGTNGVTFYNPDKLKCARKCGIDVFVKHLGGCDDKA